MANALPQNMVDVYYTRWSVIEQLIFRPEIAKKLKVAPSNLDRMVGLPRSAVDPGGISGLLPAKVVRHTDASRAFSRAMHRYESLTSLADDMGASAHTRKPAKVTHLQQAALVLGIGSFDAYVRSFTIEKYLELFFSKQTAPKKVHPRLIDAIKNAVEAQPDLVTEVARLSPEKAKLYLAETVFDAQNVFIVTSKFASAIEVLNKLGVKLNIHPDGLTTDPTEQLLHLAPPVFNAFSNARHVIVHTGTPVHRRALPYCANQEPQRFLGTFLRGLVTIIETRWQSGDHK